MSPSFADSSGPLLPTGDIIDQILGRVESFDQIDTNHWDARISYAVEVTSAGDLTQFLNVLFGNISIKPGIRVEKLDLPASLLNAYAGPRFGREGWRDLLGVTNRPLLCTALKPMGLSAGQLADLAYQFALGGIDLIKDDHGLADQSFASWQERVARCSEAVARANQVTGRHSLYLPNITGPAHLLFDRAYVAKQLGAGGLLIAPGLTGFDAMQQLARAEDLSLPLMSHPAFLGSYVTHPDQGFAHGVLFGQLMRLAGADASVFPNYGGRFSFSQEECRQIAEASAENLGSDTSKTAALMEQDERSGHVKPIFPAPGGGMSLERVPELREFYGNDVILLIGGGLFQGEGSILENTRRFAELLEM